MRIIICLIALCSVFLFSFGKKKKTPRIKFKCDSFKSLKNIPEPSDIVYDKESDHFFIVSDDGLLFECDLTGKIIRKAREEGMDFEGVEVKDGFVYVSDERPRKVYKYRKSDLSLVKIYSVSWGGAMNKAFESITYNSTKNCFVMVSQQPVIVFEYDTAFHELERHPLHIAKDINGARWYNGDIYLLSSADDCIFKCDANTYEPKCSYNIDMINPEGLAFDANGNVRVTADATQRLYFFKNLPTIIQ